MKEKNKVPEETIFDKAFAAAKEYRENDPQSQNKLDDILTKENLQKYPELSRAAAQGFAESNNEKKLREFLEWHTTPGEERKNMANDALIGAARNNHTDLIGKLTFEYEANLLYGVRGAAQAGNSNQVIQYLNHDELTKKERKEYTKEALYNAAFNGHTQLVNELIDKAKTDKTFNKTDATKIALQGAKDGGSNALANTLANQLKDQKAARRTKIAVGVAVGIVATAIVVGVGVATFGAGAIPAAVAISGFATGGFGAAAAAAVGTAAAVTAAVGGAVMYNRNKKLQKETEKIRNATKKAADTLADKPAQDTSKPDQGPSQLNHSQQSINKALHVTPESVRKSQQETAEQKEPPKATEIASVKPKAQSLASDKEIELKEIELARPRFGSH